MLAYFTLRGQLQPVIDVRIFAAPVALMLLLMIGVGLALVLSVLNALVADTALTINYALSVAMITAPINLSAQRSAREFARRAHLQSAYRHF